MKTSKERWPELYDVALRIANETCYQINMQGAQVKSEMPYKSQCILESVIKILEQRV
jgi:hypothetical protein